MISTVVMLAASLGVGAPQEAAVRVVEAPAAQQPAAGDILTELEKGEEGLRTLQADVLYDRVFDIAGDRQKRYGRIAFENDSGKRRFAVMFTRMDVGGRVTEEDQSFVFDGRWLTERSDTRKQIIKREIVREGEDFDPLRIGQGPFPLPLGQKREDILDRYDAKELSPTEGLGAHDPADLPALERFVAGTRQVLLTIKPELKESEELHEIRLWYRPGQDGVRLLPRLARTVNRQGDVTLVQLVNVKVNEPFSTDVMTPAPPVNTGGWDIREERLPPLRPGAQEEPINKQDK